MTLIVQRTVMLLVVLFNKDKCVKNGTTIRNSYGHGQHGIGLIEVLVALLLVAIAALGYIGLQAQATKSVDEALVRTQALTLLKSAAEKIRANGLQNTLNYVDATKVDASGNPVVTPKQTLDYYKTQFSNAQGTCPAKNSNTAVPSCNTKGCTPEQMADNDVAELANRAACYDIKIGIQSCKTYTGSDSNNLCLVAAWNGSDPANCINNANGKPTFGADCVFMESY